MSSTDPRLALDALAARPDLKAIDVETARLMRRLGADGASNATVERSALLLSAQRRAGASCVRLADWAGRSFPEGGEGEEAPPGPPLPSAGVWRARLEHSPLVGRAAALAGEDAAPTPLVLAGGGRGEEGGRLYFYRWWRAEHTVARLLRQRVAAAPAPPSDETRAAFGRFFGAGGRDATGQAVAAAEALFSPLTVVTGGPGTGKTYAAARLVALLLTAGAEQRVALAAPTGKAAKRLGASIAREANTLDLPEDVRAAIPTEAQTLHRLLGYRPRANRFRFGPGHPLDVDAVVVDESSMIDLLMFQALLEALPEQARVVLLGDADQLASIEAGRVLADLASLGRAGRSVAFARYVRQLGAGRVTVDENGSSLSDAVVTLRKNHRFEEDAGIAALAGAVKSGHADRAVQILRGHAYPEVQFATGPGPPPEHDALGGAVEHARRLCHADTVAEALARKEQFQVLAATYYGPQGVHATNAFVERTLLESGDRRAGRFYPGRLVLVTQNDYEQDLFNGDLGVCVSEGGTLHAHFGDGTASDGPPYAVVPARLPQHESAYAITVHKSQGSEYDEVVLLLPGEMQPPLCRELVYTAITRAKERVTIVGTEAILRAAIATPERRPSGLAEALRNDALR